MKRVLGKVAPRLARKIPGGQDGRFGGEESDSGHDTAPSAGAEEENEIEVSQNGRVQVNQSVKIYHETYPLYTQEGPTNPFDEVAEGDGEEEQYAEPKQVPAKTSNRGVHGHKDTNTDEENVEDLDTMLESMDIDRDFEMFSSFRHSMDRRISSRDLKTRGMDSTSSPEDRLNVISELSPQEEMLETQDIERWKERVQREEVFSHRYQPSKEEKKELQELERSLKTNLAKQFVTTFMSDGKEQNPEEEVWKRLVRPDPKTTPASIILKRGPVLFQSSASSAPKNGEHEAELIVMTHGFALATISHENGRNGRTFERALEYSSIVCVSPDPDEQDLMWQIVVRSQRGQERLTFVAGSQRQQIAWLEAMETVVVHHFMRNKQYPKDMGWQYRIIRKPAFTMAVLGVEDDLVIPSRHYLNQLDPYNGYAPLHYAVRLKHEAIVQSLLEEKADPNIKDEEGCTPVYYAVQDEAPESILALLESYGAEGIEKTKSLRDELFERVKATQHEREERKEQEQQRQALAAQAEMSKNMRLLQERGEKIEQASDKARQMNENAAEYSSLAAQLKEKTRKQASWNPFA